MISKRVGEYIKAKGISFYAFENRISSSRGSISKAVKDGKSIGSNVIENIMAIYTDINPAWLISGQGEMLLDNVEDNNSVKTFRLKTDTTVASQQIPLYDIEAVAGLVPLFGDNQSFKPIDHISIPNLPKCDGAVYVTGDSMYPILKSGDIVLYKKVNDIANNIFWGEMYLLSISTGDEEYITVKFVHKADSPEKVKLVSQNKSHQDKDIDLGKITAMALVKASVRMNAMS